MIFYSGLLSFLFFIFCVYIVGFALWLLCDLHKTSCRYNSLFQADYFNSIQKLNSFTNPSILFLMSEITSFYILYSGFFKTFLSFNLYIRISDEHTTILQYSSILNLTIYLSLSVCFIISYISFSFQLKRHLLPFLVKQD